MFFSKTLLLFNEIILLYHKATKQLLHCYHDTDNEHDTT